MEKSIKAAVATLMVFSAVWGFGLSFHDGGSVDIRIVAVVGNTPILSSELDQVVFMYGIKLPPDSEEVYKIYGKILNELITEQVIYQSALAESITVDEQMLEQEFSARWDSLVAQFGSEQALSESLAAEGLSLSSFKKKLKEQIKEGIIKQLFIQKHLPTVEVSDEEVKKFYEENKDSLGEYPEQVKLKGIFVAPPPESILWKQAREKSESIYDSLKGGMKFSEAAKKFSDDEKTSAEGGHIGEFELEDLPQSFRDVVKKLSPGQYSKPVKGEEGYHIIKLETHRGSKYDISHIFVKLPDKAKAAEQIAQAIYDSARSGVNFDSLLVHHCRDSALLAKNGDLGLLPINALPPSLAALVDSLGEGGILPPIPQDTIFVILRIEGIIPAHKITLEENRDYIRELARQQKFSRRLDELVRKLAENIYIEIRDKKLAKYVDLIKQ